eukprot:GHRR01030786.1.p2 GENE.GHRR01030786.1~~GHRR01030786.1.p2  ORF type:complete len:140 (-),score=36.47 GHRR01030786.1:638-1057(-)
MFLQVRGMHTIIRDASTSSNDFVFYADRLNRLVVEAGLGLLPFSEKTVITPTGAAYVGVDFARKLCGVSIIRSGKDLRWSQLLATAVRLCMPAAQCLQFACTTMAIRLNHCHNPLPNPCCNGTIGALLVLGLVSTLWLS